MTDLKISSKAHLREVLVRNGYYLPRSTTFCTLEYLAAVTEARVFVLSYEEVKKWPCARPPTKEILAKEIERILAPLE